MAMIPYQMLVERETGRVLSAGYTDLSNAEGYDPEIHEIVFTENAEKIPADLDVDEVVIDTGTGEYEINIPDEQTITGTINLLEQL